MNLLLLLTFCALLLHVRTANILIVFPIPSRSHQILGDEITKALLKKGHHVTTITPYPLGETLVNHTEIIPEGLLLYKQQTLSEEMTYNSSQLDLIAKVLLDDSIPRITFEDTSVQKLLKSNSSFDLVISEVIMCDALLGLGHYYKAPTIVVSPIGSNNIINRIVGNSEPYAYVPIQIGALTDEMSFLQRLLNTIVPLVVSFGYNFLSLPVQDKVLHDFFPDAPNLNELLHNVSLILLNAHYSIIETPRPYMPNMIPVGGFHVQPQQLTDNLKRYLNEANHGVVLFSLGSNVRSADLPADKIDIILKTFAKFDQMFLWKFENDSLKVPNNVKIIKWVPQRAVLEHKNTKAFITHGGLLSVTEAVYYGIPIIGMPAFADQVYNVANAIKKGFGITYNINSLNEETFTAAIKEILENSKYKENIMRSSTILRDQSIAPLDLAIFWIEQVLKYKGLPHLQSAGAKLGWIQGYLVDVIAFLGVLTIIICYVNYLICKTVLSFCKRKVLAKKLKSA